MTQSKEHNKIQLNKRIHIKNNNKSYFKTRKVFLNFQSNKILLQNKKNNSSKQFNRFSMKVNSCLLRALK